MVSRDYDSYTGSCYIPYDTLSMVEIRKEYWFRLWEYIGIYIRNPIGVRLFGRTRSEKERDYG